MSLVGSYAFYGKLLHDLFVTGQAKVEIVRAANVVIEEVVGTVTIKPAGGAVFQIEPTGTAVFTVKAEAGYFYVRTETGQRLDINIAHIEDGVVFNVAQSGDWTINARQTGEWNVYIQTKSDVEIRIAVVNATIALPIDIQATTIALAIDIQATTIALPVDIQAQTINLKIDIAAQSIDYIDIRIAGQIGDVNVNIANVSGEVTFNVKITDATGVTFDVKITDATGVTFDVKITDATGVTFDVKITDASGVTFNVQTEENVVLNIWTPSKRIVSAAGIIGNWHHEHFSALSGGTAYIPIGGITTDKPAAVASVGIYISGSPVADSNVFDDVLIRFKVDGDYLLEFTPRQIDYLSGGIVSQLLSAGALSEGTTVLSLASPIGGISAVTFDRTDLVIWKVGLFLNFQIEFDNTFEIDIENNTGVTIDGYVSIYWGYYR